MSDKPTFPGIQPHLNSALQQRGGGWRSFHTAYLNAIYVTLDETLPEGYYATPEEALQIGIYNAEEISGSVADVLISRRGDAAPTATAGRATVTPTLALPIPRMTAEEDALTAIMIYRADEAITRIELLSPANKRGGSHYANYRDKRQKTLESGLRLVEIDYLHETLPILSAIPSYRDRHQGAHPYHIIISDPHPDFDSGKTYVYSFGILDPIPTLNVPLADQDGIALDFNACYQQTIKRRNFQMAIDLSQLPANFGAYASEDQARLREALQQA